VLSPCCNRHVPNVTTPSEPPPSIINYDASGGWISGRLRSGRSRCLRSVHYFALEDKFLLRFYFRGGLLWSIFVTFVEEGKVNGRRCSREEEQLERERGNYSERRRKKRENDKIALPIKVEMT
jgi:hypothetical protein